MRRLMAAQMIIFVQVPVKETDMLINRVASALLTIPALLAFAGCGKSPPPQTSTVIVQPAQPQVTAMTAPTPPPPPETEVVPPPPPGTGPAVWQPGHWAYTGAPANPWSWVSGEYVPLPSERTTWIPGRWELTSTGTWMWVFGRWA
jgi:hypothetical protein